MNLIPFFTLFLRESKRFLRVFGQSITTPIISSALYLVIFGISIGHRVDLGIEHPYLTFLIPGLVMMGALTNAFQNAASSLMTSKFHGDLEDLKSSPLSSHAIVWAMSFACLLRAIIVGSGIYLLGTLFNFLDGRYTQEIAYPSLALYFVVLGSLSFGQMGLSIGFIAKTFEHLNAFGTYIILPLVYLSGIFFTTEQLNPLWRQISHLNPVLYLINGFRYAFLQTSDVPIGLCMGIALLFFCISTIFAYLAVQRGSYNRF